MAFMVVALGKEVSGDQICVSVKKKVNGLVAGIEWEMILGECRILPLQLALKPTTKQ